MFGRPEVNWARRLAMNLLGNGLHDAKHFEDLLNVQEAELSMERRLGAPEASILATQGNLATTYDRLGRHEEALRRWQDVYSSWLNLCGEENEYTLLSANNYATSLLNLQRFEEAKALMHKMVPVARRALGESNEITLKMRLVCAGALYEDDGATLDDLRKSVTTIEDTARIARRVLGGAHPLTMNIERNLQIARAALRARETPSPGGATETSDCALGSDCDIGID